MTHQEQKNNQQRQHGGQDPKTNPGQQDRENKQAKQQSDAASPQNQK
jgi:hypothetical protein